MGGLLVLVGSGVWGLITISSPNRQFPIWVGWIFLTVAAAAVVLTVNYWAHLLPVVFAYGAINGLLALSSGHIGTDSSQVISRVQAGTMAACFIACALLSLRFNKRNFTAIERAGLLGAFASAVFGASSVERATPGSLLMLVFICLVSGYRPIHRQLDSKSNHAERTPGLRNEH